MWAEKGKSIWNIVCEFVYLYINIFQFISRLIKEVILSFLSIVQDQDVKLVNSLICS